MGNIYEQQDELAFLREANAEYNVEIERRKIEKAAMMLRIAELEAALTEIRDLLPIEQDNYSRRVFAVAAEALEPEKN